MRTKEPWMLLDQETIDRLDESVWLDYKAGRCLCMAHEKGECACGAWCKCGATEK